MMADRGLTILIDTREQKPIDFSHDKLIAQEIATLSTGDYTLKGFEDIAPAKNDNMKKPEKKSKEVVEHSNGGFMKGFFGSFKRWIDDYQAMDDFK